MLQKLYTAQGENLEKTPWQAYPRPQMRRENWLNLNGQWEFAVTADKTIPENYDCKILVPFCPESLLSGIGMHFAEGSWLHYRRAFSLPEAALQGKVLLHFGAVDQKALIYVNGHLAGSHVGGYEAFSVDISAYVKQENILCVATYDDLRDQSLPYGKQTLTRGGMWYTPVSGIWQTVWVETVSREYIQALDIAADGEKAVITVTPALSGTVTFDGKTWPLEQGKAVIAPENPHLWSPEDPYLYTFTVQTDSDKVESYFALRSLQIKTVDGISRLCLNGKPYFFHGLLDQGYWSDGIYTPADAQGFQRDILEMKKLGFNTLRKHIKVEPEQFYYDCDRLGMIVFQDMVNNSDYSFFRDTALPTVGIQKLNDKNMHKDPAHRKAFLEGMEATVSQLKNHPCICYWTIFNEAWGQFDSEKVYDILKAMDDTRFIDATSGWFRQGKTDVDSLHIYFGSWSKLKAGNKPLVLSEFGGYCYAAEGHLFNPEKAYGYKTCKTLQEFQAGVQELYLQRIVPAAKKGLCAAIYTQVSDVEDEINGFLTYDRKLCKADLQAMQEIAKALQQAVQ